MRRLPVPFASALITVVAAAVLFFNQNRSPTTSNDLHGVLSTALAAPRLPDYAARGRLAMAEAMRKFPNASIIDFEYAGRSNQSSDIAEDSFMMWLLDHGRERGLKVGVSYRKSSQKVMVVRFQETSH